MHTPAIFHRSRAFLLALPLTLTLASCGGGGDGSEIGSTGGTPKPVPSGIYDSAGPIRSEQDDIIATTPLISGQDGVLVRVSWDLCDNDTACLLDAIETNLDSAASRNLKVALAVSDGHHIPPAVKSSCVTFPFVFDSQNQTLCLPWDTNYIQAKQDFIRQLGERFDDHPALGYVYFTGACSTNGFEGHCRVDQTQFTNAGYTSTKLSASYRQIMQAYVDAFPTTPIAFEVHTLFGSSSVWSDVWNDVKNSGRVGVAAWWCSERMSLNGADTVPVWSLVQQAAASSFAVCQTIGNFTSQPYRFSDNTLALDYGTQGSWNSTDVQNAFHDTLDWAEGSAVHAQQSSLIAPFAVMEVWTTDLDNTSFQTRLANYLND